MNEIDIKPFVAPPGCYAVVEYAGLPAQRVIYVFASFNEACRYLYAHYDHTEQSKHHVDVMKIAPDGEPTAQF